MSKRHILILGLIITILAISYFYIITNAVKFIQSQVKHIFGTEVFISQISATTSYIAVKRISIDLPESKLKLLTADEIRIYPAISALFFRKIILRNITLYHPSFYVYRTKDSMLILPGVNIKKKSAAKGEKSHLAITIDNISIHNGNFLFTDHKNSSPPTQILLTEIESSIRNISYPFTNNKCPIMIKSKVNKKEGNLDLKGWVNFNNLDMHVDASLINTNINLLKPYYKKTLGNLINSGLAIITSTIKMQNRTIDISGKLSLFNLHINNSEKIFVVSSKVISDIVNKNDNTILTDFQAKGKLSDPDFRIGDAITLSIIRNLSKSYGIQLEKKGKNLLKEEIDKKTIEDSINKLFKDKIH